MTKIDLSSKNKPSFGGADLSALLGGGISDITQLPIASLIPYSNQPFKPYSEAKLQQLTDDIATNGVLSPIIVRPCGSQYEILAGHNRCTASKRAGKATIPAIIKDVDDDIAALIMVNTNLNQRDELLPSEKAFAYKIQLETMKRQGHRTDLTCAQDGHKSNGRRSRDVLATQMGESKNQISRYIRLTELIHDLLQQVDDGELALVPAVALSYLSQDEQHIVLEVSADCDKKISVFQAEQLKKAAGSITDDFVREVLVPCRARNPQQDFVTRGRALVPKTASEKDVERVLEIITEYFEMEA